MSSFLVLGQSRNCRTLDPRRHSTELTLKAVLDDAQSKDQSARRKSRKELARLVESSGEDLASQLIRGMPSGNYRYKLAVAEALSMVSGGWSARESISLDILANEKRLRDETLTKNIDAAMANLISYVYYETAEDGWLTRNGQLRPVATTRRPLPIASEIREGVTLVAASAVNMRIGPSADSGISRTLEEGKCVTVSSGADGSNPVTPSSATPKGAWIRVKASPCR